MSLFVITKAAPICNNYCPNCNINKTTLISNELQSKMNLPLILPILNFIAIALLLVKKILTMELRLIFIVIDDRSKIYENS